MGILMEVKHKNLVKFLAYCNKGEKRYLCFEFLSGGSLDKLLYASKHNENEKPFSRENDILLDWESRYYIMKEVCTGLHYLHAEWSSAEKILHLDLKAGNILIDQGGVVVKIADFGISRLFDAHRTYEYLTNKFILGMRAYLPQECLTAKPKVSDKALEALGNGDVKKLIDHTLRERLEDHSVPQVLNCIRIACDCLNDDPKQRPDTKQIAQRLDH
ncbi:hypothetical protein HU200_054419 [Digitaria exilis]|uniref:Protein kinase domain-containing protein n=1 Tax=Digitaria exilis TaxID=1010633 RepID=A0A835AFT4_9POAL|nr:hypothetical protein HU200_054419 [Digitaria exilis]